MSPGRNRSLVAVLFACAALFTTASAARAQTGGDIIPIRTAPAETPAAVLVPSTSPSLDFSSLRAGLPLPMSASLAAYRWLMPLVSRTTSPSGRTVSFARPLVDPTASWRKRP